MERMVLYLTGAVIVVGILAFFSNSIFTSEQYYEDIEAYREDVGSDTVDAPALPDCARAITLTITRSNAESVSFTCTDEAERDTFVAEIKRDFVWNVFTFEGGRVVLELAETE